MSKSGETAAAEAGASGIPRHVAIVMDGNGRWAQGRGQPRHKGHQAGARSVRRVIESAAEHGVEVLSLFAFSSENWDRPSGEITSLMELFRRALKQSVSELHQHGVRVRFLGERERFPADLRRRMADAEALTAGNDRLKLNIAAGFGGRWDLVQASRQLAAAAAAGELAPHDITEDLLSSRLSLGDQPAPDLFIRTGGEYRISNFFLWDLAYTEIYFTDCLWPDFDAGQFRLALEFFAGRERRFGKVQSGLGGLGQRA
jgi:undecaprenyl diphosphate synthase